MTLRTILVVVSLVLSVLLGLVLARGKPEGNGVPAAQRLVIGLSMDTLKEARWQADRDLFVQRCKELGAEVEYLSAESNDTQQVKDCEALLTKGVRVLVVIPHDGKAMATAVEAAHKAGTPVIAYDRIINNCDLDLYLTFDNVKVGELQARFLVDHLPTPGKGKIVRVYGAPTDNNAKMFKAGQDNVLKGYIDRGDIQVLHEDWADDWRPDRAKQIVDAAIAKLQGTRFDGILASNDGTAGGAIQALIAAAPESVGKIVVTGQDADLAACQRIVAGTQAMTVYKPVKRLATRAAEIAVAMARGKPIFYGAKVSNGKIDAPAVLEEIVAVTRENMVETVVKDQFQKYEDVYRSVPDSQRPPRP